MVDESWFVVAVALLGGAVFIAWLASGALRGRRQQEVIEAITDKAETIFQNLREIDTLVGKLSITGDDVPRSQRIYLATSWKNPWHEELRDLLRSEGFEVFDFKAVRVDGWPPAAWTWEHMHSVTARDKFTANVKALQWCDTVVAVMPFGRSASMELGWAVGAGKRTAVYVDLSQEPELMLHLADFSTIHKRELVEWLHGEDYGKDIHGATG